MTTITGESLYRRPGGNDAIARVVGALYGRLFSHHHTWYCWKGRSAASRAAEEHRFIDLVCASAGGPAAHRDGGVALAPTAPGVGKVERGTFVGLAAESLAQSGLEGREQEDLFLALLHARDALTVTEPAPSATSRFAGYAPGLTDREKEVLRLLALGKSNAEIAQELYISINTVTRHLTNIFLKTDTRNRVEAAVYAVRHNFI